MHIKRHFIGWDGPIVEKVSRWLLEGRTGTGPVDFHDILIMVPTLQAGRRLREVLAWQCHERKTVLISAMIVTPHYFFSCYQPETTVANPAMIRAVWTQALEQADLSKFSAFFPQPGNLDHIDKFQWALATGEMIERLRQELADGGYSIRDVISRHAAELQELERWNDLAGLEKLYLEKLKELGFSDSCVVKIGLAETPQIEPDITRIVLVGVPDPTLLALRALENLARNHNVDILVHAPEAESAKFDNWGRPVPAAWANEKVDIPGWDNNVFLESSPESEADRVVELLSGLPADYGPADIGIGVPDAAVIPFLDEKLRAISLPAFDPADAPFIGHSLGRLVETMFKLLQSHAYGHVADLLRNHDFLRYLHASHDLDSLAILSELDEFQNYYLPVTLESMLAAFRAARKGNPGGREDFTVLGKALENIESHVKAFDREPLEAAWRSFMGSVYETRKLNEESAKDREFREAVELMEDTFRELREFPDGKMRLDKNRLNNIFFRRLRDQVYHRERAGEILDLQGWLELPWTDTKVLFIAGLNEEFVPGGSLGNVFLPDSLRKVLSLRDDLSRFSRDVFLLKGLVESRRHEGRLCIIAGKRTLSGDPLRPARLLFQCGDEDLPDRARQLFKHLEQAAQVPASATIFRLKPAACAQDRKILERKIISVTAFRDYLACPFRFYLKHILRMDSLDDDKIELDALDFGTIMHDVLQVMGADRKLWACGDAVLLGRDLAKLADDAAAQRYGKDLPLGTLAAMSAARARLEAFAAIQVELATGGWEIVATEQKKSVIRNGFTINGKIDRIDRHKASGRIRVIDYKTSDSPKPPDSRHLEKCREETGAYNEILMSGKPNRKGNAKGSAHKWVDLQLPLYSLLYRGDTAFDPNIELAYFTLPKAVKGTGLIVWDGFTAEILDSAVKCADGILTDIAARRFWPPSDGVPFDDFETLFLDSPERTFDIEGFPP